MSETGVPTACTKTENPVEILPASSSSEPTTAVKSSAQDAPNGGESSGGERVGKEGDDVKKPRETPKTHVRSASHGGVLATTSSLLWQPLNVTTAVDSSIFPPFGSLSKATMNRPSALKKPCHQRAFSQGQVVDVQGQVTGHSRMGSKTDFILPPGHREEAARPANSFKVPSFRGHSRQASRSESIYTIRRSMGPPWWRRLWMRYFGVVAEEPRLRTIVPNHLVPQKTPPSQHPNGVKIDNKIRTTKYTLLTFIPRNLLEQFHRVANLYFIFMVLLNWSPAINAFGKEIATIPVVFVLGVTAVKDFFEDRRRCASDQKINKSTCRVYVSDGDRYKKVAWKDAKVGDLVHLSNNELVPADVLLLRSSSSQGVAYLDTCNLDGETNLKQRQVVGGFLDLQNFFQPSKFRSVIEVDRPSTRIYRFNGTVIHPTGARVPISTENLLLRGCLLKNTDFVEGIVVYAGHETKSMLNNGGPRYKRSRLEKQMNVDVVWCIIILLVLCIVGAVGCRLWLSTYVFGTMEFIPFLDSIQGTAYEGMLTFWTFVVILQVMIPLSLYVTIEMTKIGQIYHIGHDPALRDPDTGRRAECRALNITEELGQVQYIFSDKTGTLTENKMLFRRCVVDDQDYQHYGEGENIAPCPRLKEDLLISSCRHRLQEFLISLAICNTVVVNDFPHRDVMNSSGIVESPTRERVNMSTRNPEAEIQSIYEAESPDELALVKAAQLYNFKLIKRSPTNVVVSLPNKSTLIYEILQILPFDSSRKCMSIIVRHPSGEIILYSKGADSTILASLSSTEEEGHTPPKILQCLHSYARQGLRTLVVARRMIGVQEYELWRQRHVEAESAYENRERRIRDSYSSLEKQLTLLGATGIEDKLQPGVPEAMKALSSAGIVIWLLTGDKPETAVNVAYAACLFSPTMQLLRLQARSKSVAETLIHNHLEAIQREDFVSVTGSQRQFPEYHNHANNTAGDSLITTGDLSNERIMYRIGNSWKRQRALIVDGKTLTFILDPKSGLLGPFLELTSACSSVLACRATPLQKAYIVRVVKEKLGKRTLAIGDGANDVSMIRTADIGVGVSGREGTQAAMAADFAVGKFPMLVPLLLLHGHWCYDRLSRMILYFFYKNAIFVFLTFWYQLYCGFSGAVMFDQIYLMLYNLFFTSLPPLALGIYDRIAPASVLLETPRLYERGRSASVYQPHSFWVTMAEALYQSIVIFFVTEAAYHDSDVGIWEFGTTVMSSCIIVMLAHVSIETRSWTIIQAGAILLSLGAFFVFCLFYNAVCVNCMGLTGSYWVMEVAVTRHTYWLTIIISSIIALLPRLTYRAVRTTVAPDMTQIAAMKKVKSGNQLSSQSGVELVANWSRSAENASIGQDRVSKSNVLTTVVA